MTTFTVHTEAPPLRRCADGSIRIGQSRVLLECVVHAFQDGATPEEIIQRFPSLMLGDVYAVVAYYLRHSNEISRYLTRCEKMAGAIRQGIERRNDDLRNIRDRLLARRKA